MFYKETNSNLYATQWNQAVLNWWHRVWTVLESTIVSCVQEKDGSYKSKLKMSNGHKQSKSPIIPRESCSCWDYSLSAERVEAIKIVWVNSLSEQLKVSVAVSYSHQTCPGHHISWQNHHCKPIQFVKGIFWFQYKLSSIDSIFGIMMITTTKEKKSPFLKKIKQKYWLE